MPPTLPLETALFALKADDRDSRIVARHYGLDGQGGANFQQIGREVGLTRERVRQIVSESDPQHYFKAGGLAALDRVIATIASRLPARAESVEAGLQADGLTSGIFRLEGIIEIAALLRRPAPFRLRSANETRFVVDAAYPRFGEIVSKARQKVRRHGMASIADCVAVKTRTGDASCELDLVKTVLSAHRDFQWLDQRAGWFWFSDPMNNRVARRVRKMLAVANPLRIDEVRAGLSRMGHLPAPDKVLIEFCRQLPGVSVSGASIRADREIDAGEVLNRTEREIFQLLSEHNGCMTNSELIYRSHGLGMKRPTFYQCVTYSPIVARHNRSQYRLIGWQQASGGAAD